MPRSLGKSGSAWHRDGQCIVEFNGPDLTTTTYSYDHRETITMSKAWNRLRGSRQHDYTPLPLNEKEPFLPARARAAPSPCSGAGLVLCLVGGLFAVYGIVWYVFQSPCFILYY